MPASNWPLNGFPVLSTNAVTRSMHYTHTSHSFAPPHTHNHTRTHVQVFTAQKNAQKYLQTCTAFMYIATLPAIAGDEKPNYKICPS